MNANNNLSPGFSTIDDAIALIKSDTRQNPVVDMDYLVAHIKWIEVAHNFRIPKIRRLKPEEVHRTRYGKIKEYETIGEVNVYVATLLNRELLRQAILDKFRELVGHEYKEITVRGRSTVADDAQGREAVRPRANQSNAKAGDSIGEGIMTSSNGEGLAV